MNKKRNEERWWMFKHFYLPLFFPKHHNRVSYYCTNKHHMSWLKSYGNVFLKYFINVNSTSLQHGINHWFLCSWNFITYISFAFLLLFSLLCVGLFSETTGRGRLSFSRQSYYSGESEKIKIKILQAAVFSSIVGWTKFNYKINCNLRLQFPLKKN